MNPRSTRRGCIVLFPLIFPFEDPTGVDDIRRKVIGHALERLELVPARELFKHCPVNYRFVGSGLVDGEDVVPPLHGRALDTGRK